MSQDEHKLILDVNGMPDLIAAIRFEVARMLREVALDEEPKVADRLNEIATMFECGQEHGV